MKIYEGKLGAEGNVSVDLSGGVLSVSATEDTPGLKVSLSAGIPVTYFIDAGAQKLNSPLAQSIAVLLDGVLKTIQ